MTRATPASLWLLALAACGAPEPPHATTAGPRPGAEVKDLATPQETHLHNLRQLTFGADNAEAYWSFGGDRLIMQTNRAPYKCDQIEELTVATGERKLVSTGKGRTTCSFFLKGDQDIIYASTHEASPECPTPPDMSKGYYWGLFDYDIYRANADGSNLRRLTSEPGYDAEATVCPVDGSIVFTSMRYGDLELWRMDADGKNLKQLTNAPGYDGGAFFSPDCSKIVWRASRPQGKDLDEYKALLAQHLVKPTKMDLYVANADGSDARQLTYLPGASFAPFFFPDGKRVIFASNYLAPKGPRVRPVRDRHRRQRTSSASPTPPGSTASRCSRPTASAWRSRRTGATWSRARAARSTASPAARPASTTPTCSSPTGSSSRRRRRGPMTGRRRPRPPPRIGSPPRSATSPPTTREGRGVGTKGLEAAAHMVEDQLTAAGVEPGAAGAWRQPFEATTAVTRKPETAIELDGTKLAEDDATPVASSASATATGEIVPVGWGIVDEATGIDDYKGKNVKGKIALVHRFVPPEAALAARAAAAPGVKVVGKLDAAATSRLGDLRYKAFIARGKGAIGLIVVDDGDPTQDEAPLPRLAAAESESQIPIVIVTRKAAAGARQGPPHGAARGRARPRPHRHQQRDRRDPRRRGGPSARRRHRRGAPRPPRDGRRLERARPRGQRRAQRRRRQRLRRRRPARGRPVRLEAPRRHRARRLPDRVLRRGDGRPRQRVLRQAPGVERADHRDDQHGHDRPDEDEQALRQRRRVGQGVARPRSPRRARAERVDCTIGGSGYGPSDHMPFYIAGSPVLFFFTGSHPDYHTATDDADKINAIGGAKVAAIAGAVTVATAAMRALTYVKAPPEPMGGDIPRRGASLGTVPSYDEDPARPKGLVLSDVVPGGPAAAAGLKAGDRITQIDTHEIANASDLMFVLTVAKPGQDARVTYVRDGKTYTVTATYGKPRSRK